MILIVSNPKDGHVTPVCDELTRRGADFAIYDPATYPKSSTITVGSGTRSRLAWDNHEIDVPEIDAFWYRRPGDFVLPDELSAGETSWLRTECGHVLRALWESSTGIWVSAPDAVRRAGLKLLQLEYARALGFAVPDFVVTNDVAVARRFVAAHPHGVVVKALANPAIHDGDRVGSIYTHVLTPSDIAEIDSVQFGPAYFSAFVPKLHDVRVTVVGDQVFAVAIESADDPLGRVDFRRAEVYDLVHRIIDLPGAVADSCRNLVSQLGLRFGAIDLLQTPEGDFVFLEINPNGQWLWLEQITGVPLTSALCNVLTSTGPK